MYRYFIRVDEKKEEAKPIPQSVRKNMGGQLRGGETRESALTRDI